MKHGGFFAFAVSLERLASLVIIHGRQTRPLLVVFLEIKQNGREFLRDG